MTRERSISVVTIIALALTTGGVVGLLVGRLWAHQIDVRARRTFEVLASTVQRRHDPEQWARDSAARDRLAPPLHWAEPQAEPRQPPRPS